MYQLFCDSNCELWHTTVKELGLHVIRMPYVMDGEEIFYDMGEKHDFKGFFDKMRAGATPKTAALNEYAYMEYFEPILASGEDIYYITFSHQMSGTFNAMKNVIAQLKEKYPEREIRFKDSKLISLGSGFVTYYGALKYKEGATMDELDAYVEQYRPDVAVLTVPQSVAQPLADRLIDLGIRGFWNFTNVELSSSNPNVKFENIHFADSLLPLSYRIANR